MPCVPISSAAPINRPQRPAPRGKTAPAKISPTMAAAPARSSRSTRKKSGYTPGSPRRQRRVTQAEILRRTRRRRFLGMLAVLAIGAFVSVNLLFKVAIFRVENFDHSTPRRHRHLYRG